ncbi:hypothetical protein GRAN_5137 [Granulicella sibirica]|uniref:Uncharacterized protein n=1 Tax=Granulicella sibirica TaxID=2479048 RepID=A0A4Q0SWJ8_9BACT|nr:hypothetical protein GRAN_5137 [Granulicella sibirica]
MAIEGFDSGATGQGTLTGFNVHDLGIELTYGAQSLCLSSIALIERLSQHILSARRIVTEIEPIAAPAQTSVKCSIDCPPAGPGVNAADYHIERPIVNAIQGTLMEVVGDSRPARSPKEIDSVDQYGCFVLSDVGDREGLPDAVGR